MKLLQKYYILFFFLWIGQLSAQDIQCDHIVTAETQYINSVEHMPGDTFCLEQGSRGPLYIKSLIGTPDSAIVFINYQGVVNIESEIGYGISIYDCRYIKILGTGDDAEYGIRINQVTSGSGIKAGLLTSDMEIANIEISNTKYTGITAKSDPTCQFNSVRDSFTMYNTHIHHNYIHDVGTEGMYLGHSFFTGVYLEDCDTTVQPHILDGVDIHHNIIERSGWDGIQLGCALYNSKIHDNIIIDDSEEEKIYQMSGIMINPGSACDVYNNQIINGKGTGISLQGVGGQKIFNNLIVNAGIGYEMNDQISAQKFGIFCKYELNEGVDSSFLISQNTIINPKSDGIRFQNQNSSGNKFYNNVIVNPGAFQYYEENGNTSNSGMDSYIYMYYPDIEFDSSNNYFVRSSASLYFTDTVNFDYRPNNLSPLINRGLDMSEFEINFDLDNDPRPFGGIYDIGAFEFSGVGLSESEKTHFHIYPNPFTKRIYLINNDNDEINSFSLYDMEGTLILSKDSIEDSIYNLEYLSRGIYLAEIITKSNHKEMIKLIKL